MESKITKKMHYEGMIAYFEGADTELTETQFIEFCKAQIADLDKKAAKAKERAAAKKAEADELTNLVHAALTGEFQSIADIAAVVAESDAEATVAKITNRLTRLVDAGVAEREQLAVETGEGKKRKCMHYKLRDISAPVEEDEE